MKDVLEDWSKNNVNDEKTKEEFDIMMADYDIMIRKAGYSLPETIPELTAKFLSFDDHILDLCCGTGLVGKALYDKGYRALSGIDFSDNIKIAESLGCYSKLDQINLNELTLHLEADVVLMIGSLTYFDPEHIFSQIIEFIDFKYFIFSHRVDMIDESFNRALKNFQVKHIFENVEYLPNSVHYSDKPVNVYVLSK